MTFKGLLAGLVFLAASCLVAFAILNWLTEIWTLPPLLYGVFFIINYFLFNIIFFRLILLIVPESQREGDLALNKVLEWVYDIYLTQALFCFHWITESKLFPIPIRTLLLKCLGAQLGKETYPSGCITDPFLILTGRRCVIGLGSILTSHAAAAGRVSLAKIQIGDCVTIGGNVLIYPGVKIGSNSIVAGGAVVLENQVIPANEIWGGVPAKFIKKI